MPIRPPDPKKKYNTKRKRKKILFLRRSRKPLKYYTLAQESMLTNWTYSNKELAIMFDRSEMSIAVKKHKLKHPEYNEKRNLVAKKLNIKYQKQPYKEFKKAEIKEIMQRAIPDIELAKKYGRSLDSIRTKRKLLKKAKYKV